MQLTRHLMTVQEELERTTAEWEKLGAEAATA